MKTELRQILENSSMGPKETEAVYTELLNLFSVSGRFYSDEEIEELKEECYKDGVEDGGFDNYH